MAVEVGGENERKFVLADLVRTAALLASNSNTSIQHSLL
jgi:hypothetical protein